MVMSKDELKKAKVSRECVEKTKPRGKDLAGRWYHPSEPKFKKPPRKRRKVIPERNIFDILREKLRGGE